MYSVQSSFLKDLAMNLGREQQMYMFEKLKGYKKKCKDTFCFSSRVQSATHCFSEKAILRC